METKKWKSRKWWITIICAAYFALMAIREQGMDNTIATIVSYACAAVVVIGYVLVEGMVDESHESIDVTIEEDDGEAEG
ncbi:MAG: hypothetical protein LUD47_05150 [Clostridia bacterium]|nr:hypothetical protein [Clostridia bacterium]